MDEQTAAALVAANKFRVSAANYRKKIDAGDLALDTAIIECDEVLRIEHLLKAYPRVGKSEAARLCRIAGVNPLKYVKRGEVARRNAPNMVCTKNELARLQELMNERMARREKRRLKREGVE